MSEAVLLLPGDGIGPDVIGAAARVLETVRPSIEFSTCEVGLAALETIGRPYPADLLERARRADAIMLGAVGGAQDLDSDWELRPEAALFALRKGLDLFANLRPIRSIAALSDRSVLRPEYADGVDVLIVRELVGGAYFGRKGFDGDVAFDTIEYSAAEVERVVRLAFDLARRRRGRVTSVDKANILRSSQLWRRVADAIAAEGDDVVLDHLLVDNAALQLLLRARSFDVVVTENLFGDILSDSSAAIVGGLGMLPSASLGSTGPGLFEPVHGSAPDIAGRGVANPYAAILSAALLLRFGLDDAVAAGRVERAVDEAISSGARTPDLGGDATTDSATAAVLAALASS